MIVSSDEAAVLLGITTTGVRRLVMRGQLTPLTPGARPLEFVEDDVIGLQVRRRTRAEREAHERAVALFERVAC